jgi:F-box domain
VRPRITVTGILNNLMLPGLPLDILRPIFELLNDEDLISFRNVCHLTRTIALVVFLSRYRSHLEWNDPLELRFSSPVIDDLEHNFRAITTLNCRLQDLSSMDALNSVVASLPNLCRLFVESPPENLHTNLSEGRSLLPIIFAFFVRSPSDRCNYILLERRHVYMAVVNGRTTLPRLYAALSWNKDFKVRHVAARGILSCTSLLVHSSPLYSDLTTNWTLAVHNVLRITWLSLGRADFEGKCGIAIMSELHLPALIGLNIGENSRLSINDLFGFLLRHPNIRSLFLEHCALSRESLEELKRTRRRWPLPSLASLTAPVPYILTILDLNDRDSVCRLKDVCFGVHDRDFHQNSGRSNKFLCRFFASSDDYDRRFSFKILDEVLHKLSLISPAIGLSMVFPNNVSGIKWRRKWKNEGLHVERILYFRSPLRSEKLPSSIG